MHGVELNPISHSFRGGLLGGIMLIANLLGAAIFLWVASKSWIEPQLQDYPGASGGSASVWFFSAMPVFLVFALLDFVVLMWAIFRTVQYSRLTDVWWLLSELWWLWVSMPIWWTAFVLDNSRHGI